jgi:selenocysteine-specific translation elongation factor
MPNLNIAVLGKTGYSRELGKKGTDTDVTLYNVKKGQITQTIIEASKYPEKLQSLFFAASFADLAVLVVDEINAAFGEIILMLDCLGVKEGIIVLRNYITSDQIKRFIKGTVLENYETMDEDLPILRQKLQEKADAVNSNTASDTGAVIIDHAFNVRGIGAVALGVVRRGQIHKHDKLKALPSSKEAQIRSIQKHDDDFETAQIGDRVGVALKNIEADEVERGMVLTNDPSVQTIKSIKGKLVPVKYWNSPINAGMSIHVGNGMQFLTATIETTDNGEVEISLQKPLVYLPGDKATVMYLNGGNLRVVGTIQLA